MITREQLQLIEAAAAADVDRPELRCQFAMADIYKAAGLLPSHLEIPDGNRDWSRTENCSLFTPWIEGCGFFETVNTAEVTGRAALDLALPGDLLGFRLARVIHHVSILLAEGRMVHVFGYHGVKIAPCIPGEWAVRVDKVWRPIGRSVLNSQPSPSIS